MQIDCTLNRWNRKEMIFLKNWEKAKIRLICWRRRNWILVAVVAKCLIITLNNIINKIISRIKLIINKYTLIIDNYIQEITQIK